MSDRIPAAVGWLIRRRARLQGLLNAIEAELQRLDRLKARQDSIREDVRAIDRTLGLYDVPIDGSTIPSVRPSGFKPGLLRPLFKHGELTRSLLRELRNSPGGELSTTELAERLLKMVDFEKAGIPLSDSIYLRLKRLLRQRLKGLCWDGKVIRLHEQRGNAEGRWRLVDQ